MKALYRTQKGIIVLFVLAGITPSFALEGEFKNYCANSLANSRVYQTTCEVHETIDGKVYCFGNQKSKEVFMKDTRTNLHKASVYFESIQSTKP